MASRTTFLNVPADSHFPIQNLPYGVFSTPTNTERRVGVAIGEEVLDLAALERHGLLLGGPELLFASTSLNRFMASGRSTWKAVRERLLTLLDTNNPVLRDNLPLREEAIHRQDEVTLHLPVEIGDYTDFYSSRHHAFNVGTMFRGAENALMPNYLHLPVAYHGRASSVVTSGTAVRRPSGQIKPAASSTPHFAPCRLLDFELEMGFFIGGGSTLGEPVSIDDAEEHIFGFVLVNDWSARDIQTWEYQPLGPFNSKNFATSISPWVVTLEALEPFRTPGPAQDPTPLPYLQSKPHSSFDIRLDIHLQTEKMRSPDLIARSNFRHLYWTPAQQVAHHTVTGCNLRTGDLLASGTISGPEKHERGSLLELSWRGTEPISMSSGETRTFLEDGDTVIISGVCERDGYRIGFGEVSGKVLPAR